MQVITYASLKGGVAKTTTTGYLAAALAAVHPGRVLAIDADPNNNLTDLLLRDIDEDTLEGKNLLHVFTRKLRAEETIYRSSLVPNLDVIPAVPELAHVGAELFANPMAVCLGFPAALRKLPYDFILIDAPPALTLEFRASLYAADHVVIPTKLHRWALQAYILVQREVEEIQISSGKAPRIRILATFCNDGQADKIRKTIPGAEFCTTNFPKIAAIENATTAGTLLKAGSVAARAFEQYAEEVKTWH
jgi:chromosome partitioning protein